MHIDFHLINQWYYVIVLIFLYLYLEFSVAFYDIFSFDNTLLLFINHELNY